MTSPAPVIPSEPRSSRHSRLRPVVALALLGSVTAGLVAACGSSDDSSGPGGAAAGGKGDGVTVQNCGKDVTFPQPMERMFVNDGGMIAMSLAAGARPQMTAVSSLARDKAVLELKYGTEVDGLNEVTEKSPTLENVVATRPQMMYAGWNYGFSESKGLTPETLAAHDIATYQLSEACLQTDGEKARGTMDPWTALDTDLKNIGTISGHADTGEKAAKDVADRLAKLRSVGQPEKKPTVFLFDSGEDTIFSSGRFGGPQGIIDAAGGRNAIEDVSDTWTKVSWERLTTSDPDVIVFVDYPGQTAEQKIEALRANPASRNLKAVREGHFLNLPYAMLVSSPLNIDAAEILRQVFERHQLAPVSDVRPSLDLASLHLAGNDWLE